MCDGFAGSGGSFPRALTVQIDCRCAFHIIRSINIIRSVDAAAAEQSAQNLSSPWGRAGLRTERR